MLFILSPDAWCLSPGTNRYWHFLHRWYFPKQRDKQQPKGKIFFLLSNFLSAIIHLWKKDVRAKYFLSYLKDFKVKANLLHSILSPIFWKYPEKWNVFRHPTLFDHHGAVFKCNPEEQKHVHVISILILVCHQPPFSWSQDNKLSTSFVSFGSKDDLRKQHHPYTQSIQWLKLIFDSMFYQMFCLMRA